MKALIVSDTHGNDGNFFEVTEKEKDVVLIIHAGDACGLEDYIEETTGIPCYIVAGNNDYYSNLPHESIIMLGKHRVLLTHGHTHGISYGNMDICRYAEGLGCDTVICGHTHRPDIDDLRDVLVVNPGSLTYPRQPGRAPSYIIAEVSETGDVEYEIKYL